MAQEELQELRIEKLDLTNVSEDKLKNWNGREGTQKKRYSKKLEGIRPRKYLGLGHEVENKIQPLVNRETKWSNQFITDHFWSRGYRGMKES